MFPLEIFIEVLKYMDSYQAIQLYDEYLDRIFEKEFINKNKQDVYAIEMVNKNLNIFPTFIKYIDNLEILNLSYNKIKSVKLSHKGKLTNLKLNNNLIEHVSLYDLSVNFLDLSYNNISNFHLNNFDFWKLRSLVLMNNKLTNVNITSNSIQFLYLQNNLLRNENLIIDIPKLFHLNISNNQITRISRFSKIKEFEYNNNPVPLSERIKYNFLYIIEKQHEFSS